MLQIQKYCTGGSNTVFTNLSSELATESMGGRYERKCIVNKSKLMELFKNCNHCGMFLEVFFSSHMT